MKPLCLDDCAHLITPHSQLIFYDARSGLNSYLREIQKDRARAFSLASALLARDVPAETTLIPLGAFLRLAFLCETAPEVIKKNLLEKLPGEVEAQGDPIKKLRRPR